MKHVWAALVLAGCVFIYNIGFMTAEFLHERVDAKTECARYHPETGRFEWVK